MKGLTAISMLLAASVAAADSEAGLPPLADNSFLIEEAYNQEAGVVQNIFTFSRDRASGAWALSYTNEWPAPAQAHQLSYTVNYAGGGDAGSSAFGDLLLNYRYQAAFEDGKLAFSPRLSAVVPTGAPSTASGYRGFGLQANLPVSTRLSSWLVAHSNLGYTWVPSGKAGTQAAEWRSWCMGQSFILEPHPRFNLMLEAVFTSTEQVTGGASTREDALFLSPGVRWGIDLPADVQVVLGLAVPLGVGPSDGERAVFAYLSVELPYWRPAASAD